MNRFFCIVVMMLLLPVLSWAGGSKDSSTGTGVSLMEAIDLSADRIAEDVGKYRIAVVAFETENNALSDFIIAELSGALHDRNIEIVGRQGLNWVMQELDFQMSGAVSDETMQSLGKFMGAEIIVTGQLRNLGGNYRLTATAVRVEQLTNASLPRFDVRNDRAMRNMIAALGNQSIKTRAADYGATVDTNPQSAGTFLDRGIQFAMRGEFDQAIADFTEALRLNPSLEGAYILRGRAYIGSISQVTGIDSNFGAVTTGGRKPGLSAEQAEQVYDLAIADFSSAIQTDPKSSVAFRERGRVYLEKGDNDRAIADFNEAIRLNPRDTRAYSNRGNAYNYKGDFDRAIADFESALRIDPNHAFARQRLDETRQARGR